MCRKVLSSQDEQLESMENGLLRKPAQEEIFEELVGDSEGPQQSLQAAQPRPCSPVEEASEDEIGVLGNNLVVAGGLVVSAGGAGAEEQRPPFLDDGKISVWWLVPDGRDVGDGKVVVGDGSLVMEFGAHDSPPLLQQQQKLLAPPPQEPWPPPMAVEHEGSGAGISGNGRLELERRVIFGDGVEGADDESFLGRDGDEEDTVEEEFGSASGLVRGRGAELSGGVRWLCVVLPSGDESAFGISNLPR